VVPALSTLAARQLHLLPNRNHAKLLATSGCRSTLTRVLSSTVTATSLKNLGTNTWLAVTEGIRVAIRLSRDQFRRYVCGVCFLRGNYCACQARLQDIFAATPA